MFSNNQKLLLQLGVVHLDVDLQVEAHQLDHLMHKQFQKFQHQLAVVLQVVLLDVVHLAALLVVAHLQVHQIKLKLLVAAHQVVHLAVVLLVVHLAEAHQLVPLDKQKLLVVVPLLAHQVEAHLQDHLVVVHLLVLLEQ